MGPVSQIKLDYWKMACTNRSLAYVVKFDGPNLPVMLTSQI